MTKPTTETPVVDETPAVVDPAPLTAIIADILDLRSLRGADVDGYFFLDFVEDGRIGGRVLAAADDSELLTVGIVVTVS